MKCSDVRKINCTSINTDSQLNLETVTDQVCMIVTDVYEVIFNPMEMKWMPVNYPNIGTKLIAILWALN